MDTDIPFATGRFAVFPGMPGQATIPGLLSGGRPEFAISGRRSAVPSTVTRVWLRPPLAASWLPALVTILSPRGWSFL